MTENRGSTDEVRMTIRRLLSKSRRSGKPEPVPPRGEAGRRYLESWGLDRVLGEDDDPELWVAALFRYWPAPTDPELDPSGLRFCVGDVAALGGGGMMAERAAAEHGAELEIWCFVPRGNGGLRAVSPEERRELEERQLIPTVPKSSLYVDRPSKGVDNVYVGHNHVRGPLDGRGATVEWAYDRRDGMWKPENVRVVRMS